MRIKGKGVKNLTSFPLLPFLICSNATSKRIFWYWTFRSHALFYTFSYNSVLAPHPWSGGNGSTWLNKVQVKAMWLEWQGARWVWEGSCKKIFQVNTTFVNATPWRVPRLAVKAFVFSQLDCLIKEKLKPKLHAYSIASLRKERVSRGVGDRSSALTLPSVEMISSASFPFSYTCAFLI